mmetsp:Transcript_20275/g.28512  ORF Transcript_20275/g.28512 Transcript_20275/m.28512 type:complete len:100 (+) Transcript_20275:500-799(+)
MPTVSDCKRILDFADGHLHVLDSLEQAHRRAESKRTPSISDEMQHVPTNNHACRRIANLPSSSTSSTYFLTSSSLQIRSAETGFGMKKGVHFGQQGAQQ